MMKLLIADDEALALVGLRSMLEWEKYDIEICSTAYNGEQALQCISQYHPDIVITDIKMPIKSGLDVLEESRQHFGDIPVFIILTSYEEFSFAKKALYYDALEYLVKPEITPQSLSEAVIRACAKVKELRASHSFSENQKDTSKQNMQSCRDAFFSRMYFNFFDSEEDFINQSNNLELDLQGNAFAVAAFEISEWDSSVQPQEQISLFTSIMQMVRDSCQKFYTCYMTSLDVRHFNILFCLNSVSKETQQHLIQILRITISDVKNYFNLGLTCAIGKAVTNAFYARRSYRSACSLIPALNMNHPIIIDDGKEQIHQECKFNFSAYRDDLIQAFHELNDTTLFNIINEISANFEGKPSSYMQAMNAAISLLHMSISLFPEGEDAIEQIFSDLPDNYRSLYLLSTTSQYCKWISQLRDGLCENIRLRKQSHKKKLVKEVESYIKRNLDKRLLISDVASVFHFSPSYLSQLFAQYSDYSYIDYVTQEKIAASKIMMAEGNKKIYEIAELLGYNSAFYFSKVFKKVTGLTPREYMQSIGL